MKYLPVLQELVESNSVAVFLAGLLIALIAAVALRWKSKATTAALIGVVVYAVCEIVLNLHTGYLLEITLVLAGAAALGVTAGSLLGRLVNGLRKR